METIVISEPTFHVVQRGEDRYRLFPLDDLESDRALQIVELQSQIPQGDGQKDAAQYIRIFREILALASDIPAEVLGKFKLKDLKRMIGVLFPIEVKPSGNEPTGTAAENQISS